MRLALLVMALAVIGCGGGSAASTHAPTTAPATITAAVQAALTPTVHSPATIGPIVVTGGSPGDTASVVLHTDPGQVCTLNYTPPPGGDNTVDGLGDGTADSNGVIAWHFLISANTSAGAGHVYVKCGDMTLDDVLTVT